MPADLTTDQIVSRIEEIIMEHVEVATAPSPDTLLRDELAIDSLELVELGTRLGRELECAVLTASLPSCETVGDLTKLILRSRSLGQ